jgi:hypothetical protein
MFSQGVMTLVQKSAAMENKMFLKGVMTLVLERAAMDN